MNFIQVRRGARWALVAAGPRADQGDCLGRIRLRPAAGDELCGDDRVRCRYEVEPVQGALQPALQRAPRRDAGGYLSAALEYVPPTAEDRAIRARLASIGVGPGRTFEFKDLSLEHKAAVLLGMKAGDDQVDKYLASGMKSINGWQVGAFFGDESFYKGDWLMRAPAKGGLYGNDAVEAIYPYTRLYWPKTTPPSILPPGTGSWQPPAVMKAS